MKITLHSVVKNRKVQSPSIWEPDNIVKLGPHTPRPRGLGPDVISTQTTCSVFGFDKSVIKQHGTRL